MSKYPKVINFKMLHITKDKHPSLRDQDSNYTEKTGTYLNCGH